MLEEIEKIQRKDEDKEKARGAALGKLEESTSRQDGAVEASSTKDSEKPKLSMFNFRTVLNSFATHIGLFQAHWLCVCFLIS